MNDWVKVLNVKTNAIDPNCGWIPFCPNFSHADF